MSLLAMPAPSFPHTTSFRRGLPWESGHPTAADLATPSRPRMDPEQIALPSIRQVIPELQFCVADSQPSPNTSAASIATPEYIHSPVSSYKRQRVGPNGDERVPRLCVHPHLDRSGPMMQQGASPTLVSFRPAASTSASASPQMSSASSAAADGWPSGRSLVASDRLTERLLESGGSNSSSTSGVGHHSPASRPGLPGLPLLRFDREPAPMSQLRSGYTTDGYASSPVSGSDSYRYQSQPQAQPQHQHQHQPHLHSPTGPSHGAYATVGSYQHHPSRMQSLSLGSIRGFDRAAFPSSGGSSHDNGGAIRYEQQHSAAQGGYHREYIPAGEFGSMVGNAILASGGLGGSNDMKQRKRRGNLPKETTDKLRAWFLAHLHHPYPSEDEKQELMRQTGLQMNQISNWFINARRRQLPAMINNARVESDAMSSSRGGGSTVVAEEQGIAESSHRGYSSSHSHGQGHSHGHGHGKVLPTTEHMAVSERMLVPQASSLYGAAMGHQGNKHSSPMSEDDYDDMPRRHGHMKRGSV